MEKAYSGSEDTGKKDGYELRYGYDFDSDSDVFWSKPKRSYNFYEATEEEINEGRPEWMDDKWMKGEGPGKVDDRVILEQIREARRVKALLMEEKQNTKAAHTRSIAPKFKTTRGIGGGGKTAITRVYNAIMQRVSSSRYLFNTLEYKILTFIQELQKPSPKNRGTTVASKTSGLIPTPASVPSSSSLANFSTFCSQQQYEPFASLPDTTYPFANSNLNAGNAKSSASRRPDNNNDTSNISTTLGMISTTGTALHAYSFNFTQANPFSGSLDASTRLSAESADSACNFLKQEPNKSPRKDSRQVNLLKPADTHLPSLADFSQGLLEEWDPRYYEQESQ